MPAEFRDAKYDQERAKLINSLRVTLGGPKPMKRAPAKRPAQGAAAAGTRPRRTRKE